MTFAQPWFLFGFLALSIPVIVHLFNFRRPKIVYFTKVRLLKESVIEVNKTQKIKHYLVLLSRLLFLSFLILAFAQPSFDKEHKVAQNVVGIYVDNSQSMLAPGATGDALTSSLEIVERLSNNYDNHTKYVFLDNDFKGTDLSLLSRDQLKDRLTEVTVTNKVRSFTQAQNKLYQSIERLLGPVKPQLLLLSDFQKSVNKDAEAMIPCKTDLVYAASHERKNVFVDTAFVDSPMVREGETVDIKVVLACSGTEAIENIPVKLLVDDIQSGVANVKLEAGQKTQIEFSVKMKSDKASMCQIQIDDHPIVFDNIYYFVIQPMPAIKIAVVSNKSVCYYSKIFENDPSYSLNTYRFGAINYGKLKEVNMLVIDGLEEADQVLLDYANELLAKNGSVIVNINGLTEVGTLNPKFQKLGIQSVKVKQDTIGLVKENVQVPDVNNPIFKNVYKSKLTENFALPKVKPILECAGNAIYNTSSNKNVVTKCPSVSGSLFVLNTLLESAYSDFQNHPFFVTMVLRIAMMTSHSDMPLSYSIKNPVIKWPVDEQSQVGVVRLKTKGGEVLPEVYTNGLYQYFDLSKTELQAGLYEIYNDDKQLGNVALNIAHEESLLESIDLESLKSRLKGHEEFRVFEEGQPMSVVSEINSGADNNNLWKYCLMISLVFLACEVLLIRFRN